MPLQMLQKDDDLEQVGEVLNAFIWGHALGTIEGQLLGVPGVETVATFSEIMASDRKDDLFTVRSTHELDTSYPVFANDRLNRYRADAGNLVGTELDPLDPFRPYTQVLEGASASAPWTPRWPSGLAFLDPAEPAIRWPRRWPECEPQGRGSPERGLRPPSRSPHQVPGWR